MMIRITNVYKVLIHSLPLIISLTGLTQASKSHEGLRRMVFPEMRDSNTFHCRCAADSTLEFDLYFFLDQEDTVLNGISYGRLFMGFSGNGIYNVGFLRMNNDSNVLFLRSARFDSVFCGEFPRGNTAPSAYGPICDEMELFVLKRDHYPRYIHDFYLIVSNFIYLYSYEMIDEEYTYIYRLKDAMFVDYTIGSVDFPKVSEITMNAKQVIEWKVERANMKYVCQEKRQ